MQRHWLSLHRAFALLALFASTLLFVHYLAPADSDFCGGASGCEAVRQSGFSYFGAPYLNTPLFGMLAFAGLLLLGIGNPEGTRLRLLRLAAGFGGVTALGLVIVQALVVKAFCWLCMVVDLAAVGAAFSAAALTAEEPRVRVLRDWGWAALIGAAAGLPLLWHAVKPLPAVPAEIRALYVPGKINVVEFADFQCPFCRRVHPLLAELVREHGDRVNFRRLHKPLANHPFAESAARAAVCAQAQGRGDAMADKLFEGRLGDEHYSGYAKELGLDLGEFVRCLESEQAAREVQADADRFDQAGLRSLPTTYVGEEKIVGAKPIAVFREAFERAALSERTFSIPGWAFVILSLLGAALVVTLGRVRADTSRS